MLATCFLIFSLQVLALVSGRYQQCDHIYPPEHGDVEFDANHLSYRMTCNHGYILRGEREVYCRDGQWTSPPPSCIIDEGGDTCEKLQAPENGQVSCEAEPLSVGKKCYYECNEGYKLTGPRRRSCMPGLKWSGLPRYCIFSQRNVKRENNFGSRNHYETNAQKRNPCYNNSCPQICKVEEGRAQCRCRRGFILNKENQRTCDVYNGPPIHPTKQPIHTSSHHQSNPCFHNKGGCAQVCSLTREHKVFCSCRSGFALEDDRKSCRESVGQPFFNPCLENNGGCGHHCSITTNNELLCYCSEGYVLDDDQRSCIRETRPKSTQRPNTRLPTSTTVFGSTVPYASVVPQPAAVTPCSFNNGGCQHECQVTENSGVECFCYKGFKLHENGKHCVDINECSRADLNNCEHKCFNTRGSFSCSCKPGFDLIYGYKCQDVDECYIEHLNICHHFCTNTEGSFTCSCKPGYILTDGYKCEGCGKNKFWSFELEGCVDCPSNSHTVSEGAQYVSNCLCDAGFTGNPGDGIPCYDIDECSDNFGCSDTCNNIPGGAYCSCAHGFMLDNDNKTCIDIDECKIKNGGCEGVCINEHGSFHCICPEGYKKSNKDQYSCDDVDECENDNGGCEHKCINYKGGYYCSCENGYRLDREQKNCIEVQCSALLESPHSKMSCKHNKQKLQEMDTYPISTVCNFTCNKGFKNMERLSIMECQEDGMWSGKLPQCKPQFCNPLEVPENGAIHPSSCSKRGNKVKQRCTFTCRPGYKISGNYVFQCKNDLTWDVKEIPVCQLEKTQPRIECPEDVIEVLLPGEKTVTITLSEPTTNMENYEVRPNKILAGAPFEFQAGVTKVTFHAISPDSNKTARCVTTVTVLDKEPPVFEYCPDSIEIEDASADGAFVTWEKPIATDNVEVETLYSIMEPNTTLAPGTHIAEYIARDVAGNTATCSFDITITRMKCPVFENPEHGEANCVDWFHGKFCQPKCDAGYKRNADEPAYYSCDDDRGVWEPSEVISECLKFVPLTSSTCPDGFELKIIDEENVCIECSINEVWSTTSKKCEKKK